MFRYMAIALILCGVAMASPPLVNVEEAAEVTRLQLQWQGNENAVVYARVCDHCELLRLSVDADTIVERDGTRLSLDDARSQRGGATVVFIPQTRRVTRIAFWN